jgi:hypothetical protein
MFNSSGKEKIKRHIWLLVRPTRSSLFAAEYVLLPVKMPAEEEKSMNQ